MVSGAPQWLGTPLPPQVSGALQPPHLMMPPQPSATGPHSPLSQVFRQWSPSVVSMPVPPLVPGVICPPSSPPLPLPLPAVWPSSWLPGVVTCGAPEQAMATQEIRTHAALLKLRLEPTVALLLGRARTLAQRTLINRFDCNAGTVKSNFAIGGRGEHSSRSRAHRPAVIALLSNLALMPRLRKGSRVRVRKQAAVSRNRRCFSGSAARSCNRARSGRSLSRTPSSSEESDWPSSSGAADRGPRSPDEPRALRRSRV